MKAMIPLAVAAIGLLVACSSSSPKTTSSSCEDLSTTKSFTGTFTLEPDGGPTVCLKSYPFNSNEEAGASDAGSSCAPVVSGCSATISCTLSADGIMTEIEGALSASGNSFTGTGTITVTAIGQTVACQYTLSGTYE
jgi:hypothetical protein